jgi:hypothetical protein
MNEKHKQALRELAQWCKKHDAYIYYSEDERTMCVGFQELKDEPGWRRKETERIRLLSIEYVIRVQPTIAITAEDE